MQNGARIGTFCLIDSKPRHLDEWELNHLKELAKVVVQEIQGNDAARPFLASVAEK